MRGGIHLLRICFAAQYHQAYANEHEQHRRIQCNRIIDIFNGIVQQGLVYKESHHRYCADSRNGYSHTPQYLSQSLSRIPLHHHTDTTDEQEADCRWYRWPSWKWAYCGTFRIGEEQSLNSSAEPN